MHHICLLLIDVINDFEFPGGEELFAQARQIGPTVTAEFRLSRLFPYSGTAACEAPVIQGYRGVDFDQGHCP
jgi:hypothetical protein